MATAIRRIADRCPGREPWRIDMSPVPRRFVLVLPILMLATALGAGTAHARDNEKQWEVGAFGTESRYSNSTNIKSAAGYGLRVGYHLKANVEIELDYDKATSDSANQANVSYDVTKYVPTVVRIFQPKGHEKMAPFVVFGLGRLGIDGKASSENSTVYKAGGGLKYFVSPRIGIRFDAFMWRWHGHGDILPRNPFYSFDATLGVAFLLGGAK